VQDLNLRPLGYERIADPHSSRLHPSQACQYSAGTPCADAGVGPFRRGFTDRTRTGLPPANTCRSGVANGSARSLWRDTRIRPLIPRLICRGSWFSQGDGCEFGEGQVSLNGIVLISQALDYTGSTSDPDNLIACVTYLPTMAATAWYHGKVKDRPARLRQFLDEPRFSRWTSTPPFSLRGAASTRRCARTCASGLRTSLACPRATSGSRICASPPAASSRSCCGPRGSRSGTWTGATWARTSTRRASSPMATPRRTASTAPT
jgi:hypothetical protein